MTNNESVQTSDKNSERLVKVLGHFVLVFPFFFVVDCIDNRSTMEMTDARCPAAAAVCWTVSEHMKWHRQQPAAHTHFVGSRDTQINPDVFWRVALDAMTMTTLAPTLY